MPQMLLPIFPAESTSINPLMGFQRLDDMVYYFNGMMPFFSHPVSDLGSFRLITSQMIVNKNAAQKEIVEAFKVSKISVKRYVKIYKEQGAEGFFKARKGRGSAVLKPEVLVKVQGYLNQGQSVGSICDELELKRDTVNKAIRDGRLQHVKVEKKSPFPA